MKNYHNPYHNLSGQWIRANLHGHCRENSGCSSVPLKKGAQMYHDIGAHAMAVTDHDTVTDLSLIREAFSDMVFINGFEYSSRENIVFIGENVPDLFNLPLEEALSSAGDIMTIICHPEPNSNWEYWTVEMLEALGTMPKGVEVYNGHYSVPKMIARGSNPYYADFWDSLLTRGHKVWGFANDDFHDLVDFDNAFNMVHVDRVCTASVLDSVSRGRCYGTTGLLLSEIEHTEQSISIVTSSRCKGKFVGPGGTVLAESNGSQFSYILEDDAYVRFEASGEEGRLFLQPFYRR